MIALKRVTPEERDVLWSVMQKYFYEMSALYDLDMDDAGDYPYPWFDAYFSEPERIAYWIMDGGRRAGFALINAHSCVDEPIDHAMAEFTVFPRHRGKGAAREAVRQILAAHPGRWEIKFNVKNEAATTLWSGVARPHAFRVAVLGDGELAYLFTVNE